VKRFTIYLNDKVPSPGTTYQSPTRDFGPPPVTAHPPTTEGAPFFASPSADPPPQSTHYAEEFVLAGCVKLCRVIVKEIGEP
jgi:hypothetical protein